LRASKAPKRSTSPPADVQKNREKKTANRPSIPKYNRTLHLTLRMATEKPRPLERDNRAESPARVRPRPCATMPRPVPHYPLRIIHDLVAINPCSLTPTQSGSPLPVTIHSCLRTTAARCAHSLRTLHALAPHADPARSPLTHSPACSTHSPLTHYRALFAHYSLTIGSLLGGGKAFTIFRSKAHDSSLKSLIIHSLSSHYPLTIHSLSTHYSFYPVTIHSLLAHYTPTIHSLFAHYPHTIRSVLVHYLLTIHTLFARYHSLFARFAPRFNGRYLRDLQTKLEILL